MQSRATLAALERLDNGGSCEAKGCYELGVWLVSFNGEASHLCSKHTRVRMRDTSRRADTIGVELEE